jgi:uncharacterized protein (DUF1786 family)
MHVKMLHECAACFQHQQMKSRQCAVQLEGSSLGGGPTRRTSRVHLTTVLLIEDAGLARYAMLLIRFAQ